jgi:hypothetical protein
MRGFNETIALEWNSKTNKIQNYFLVYQKDNFIFILIKLFQKNNIQ